MGCSSAPLGRRGRVAEQPSVIDIQSTQWPSSHSPNVFLFLSISVASPGFLSFLLQVYISVDDRFRTRYIPRRSDQRIEFVNFTFSAVVPSHEGVSAAANLTQLCTRKRVVFNPSREASSSFGIPPRAGSLDCIVFRSLYIASFAFNVER
jgi:hypothetical protein